MQTSTATLPELRTRWRIDPSHSMVEFAVRHLAIATVKGRLSIASGTIVYDEQAPERSTVEVTIDAGTVDTHERHRDADLRSANFLDVDRYPTIAFRSTSAEPAGSDRARVLGVLGLHGVERAIALDARLTGRGRRQDGAEVIGFEARTTINRKEFGLAYNAILETGGLVVGDEIRIEIDVEAVRDA
jgi:polyisoprenoid-binding protein YceI